MGSFTWSAHEGGATEPNRDASDQGSPVQVTESCPKQCCLHFIVTNNLHQPIGRLKPSVSDFLSEDSTPKNESSYRVPITYKGLGPGNEVISAILKQIEERNTEVWESKCNSG